jgi:periplasmic protein TonB
MGMDRTAHIGLGSAIGGHALLLILLSLGFFGGSEALVRPEPVTVTLVEDSAPEATTTQASDENPVPAAEIESAQEQQAAPAPQSAPEAPAPPVKTAAAKPVTAKPRPVAARPAASRPAPARNTAPPRTPGGFGRGFEDRIAGIGRAPASAGSTKAGGSGTSKTAAAPSGKPTAEVRRSVTAALASQIKPYLEACAPSGVDIDAMRTFITLNLGSNGALTSVSFNKQTGVNESNRPQSEPLKQCALKAARQASPYRGLDPAYHDVWKSHAMQLKAN